MSRPASHSLIWASAHDAPRADIGIVIIVCSVFQSRGGVSSTEVPERPASVLTDERILVRQQLHERRRDVFDRIRKSSATRLRAPLALIRV